MTSIAAPLHFAAHLFGLLVSLGAAFALARDAGKPIRRILGATAFLALVVAEGLHGSEFTGETEAVTLSLRIGALALLAMSLVAGGLRRPGGPALLGAIVLLAAGNLLLARRSSLDWALQGSHIARMLGFAAASWTVVVGARRSIRFRFMAGFVSVLLVVVLAVSVAVTQVIDRNLRTGALQRLSGQAIETARAFESEVVDRARDLVVLVEGAIEEGKIQVPPETLTRLFSDLDFIVFLDPLGGLQGQRGLEANEAIAIAGTDVVRACLAGADVASVDELVGRTLAIVGCSPILREGAVAAVAVAGSYVDDDFIDRLSPPGARAAAFRGSEPRPVAITGSFPGLRVGAPMLADNELRASYERFLLGTDASEEIETRIGGLPYFAALTPLRRTDAKVVGVLLVAESATVVARTQAEVIRRISLVTLGVIALALLLGLLAARRITHPVLALTRAARRVQSGDLAAKAEVNARDEVGDLASAFNQMTDSVTQMTDKLRAAAVAEAQLRDRLETVLNSMGDGLLAVDQSGAVVTYNPAAGAILGLPSEHVVGKQIEDVLSGRDAEGQPLPSNGEVATGMAFIRRSDGRDVPVAITSSPLRDGSNAPLGYVYVFRDMSREHEVERMKTEFLSNVSHELRTPLTPIIGYSEIMTRRGVPAERGQEFATAILDSARRLERIVAMLVDFSAMEGGRMTIEAEDVSLRKLVHGAVEDWKARAKDHSLVSKFAPRLPNVTADPSLMRRAVDELLDNAVKYSPNGGTIRVEVSSEEADGRRILEVLVQDEGIGIEEEDLPTVFEDFRQVDASDTRPYGGLGLGLAFVRRIVEAHGGTIGVESAAGQGTTFRFSIPAADTTRKGRKR